MFVNNKKGQGLTEYIILVALVAVASLGIMEVLGATINHKIAAITAKLQGKAYKGLKEPEVVREKLYRKRTLRNFWKSSE